MNTQVKPTAEQRLTWEQALLKHTAEGRAQHEAAETLLSIEADCRAKHPETVEKATAKSKTSKK